MPAGTLILKHDYSMVPIEQIVPGDVIIGGTGPTRVEATAAKGRKPVIEFLLSNGGHPQMTAEHKVHIQRGKKKLEMAAGDVVVGDRIEVLESLPLAPLGTTPACLTSKDCTRLMVGRRTIGSVFPGKMGALKRSRNEKSRLFWKHEDTRLAGIGSILR